MDMTETNMDMPEEDMDVNDLEGGAQGFFGIKEKIDIRPYIPLQPFTIYNGLKQPQKEALKDWLPWIKADIQYFEDEKEVPNITNEDDEIVQELHKKWSHMNEQLKVYHTALNSKPKRPYTKHKPKSKPKPVETKKSSSTTQSSNSQRRRSARPKKTVNYNEDYQTKFDWKEFNWEEFNWEEAYCNLYKTMTDNISVITDETQKETRMQQIQLNMNPIDYKFENEEAGGNGDCLIYALIKSMENTKKGKEQLKTFYVGCKEQKFKTSTPTQKVQCLRKTISKTIESKYQNGEIPQNRFESSDFHIRNRIKKMGEWLRDEDIGAIASTLNIRIYLCIETQTTWRIFQPASMDAGDNESNYFIINRGPYDPEADMIGNHYQTLFKHGPKQNFECSSSSGEGQGGGGGSKEGTVAQIVQDVAEKLKKFEQAMTMGNNITDDLIKQTILDSEITGVTPDNIDQLIIDAKKYNAQNN